MPNLYHGRQPDDRDKSKVNDEDDGKGYIDLPELKAMYEDYERLINKSKSTRTSDAGKKWLDIISTRIKWLSEDQTAFVEKLIKCVENDATIDEEAQRDSATQMLSAFNKFQSYKEILAKIIRHKESESKNEEVQKVLRKTYEKAHKALKAYLKSCDEAINKARAGRSA
ncbi:unnamed protein product [Alternaria alternata]